MFNKTNEDVYLANVPTSVKQVRKKSNTKVWFTKHIFQNKLNDTNNDEELDENDDDDEIKISKLTKTKPKVEIYSSQFDRFRI